MTISSSDKNNPPKATQKQSDSPRLRPFDPQDELFQFLLDTKPAVLDETDLEDEERVRFVKDVIRKVLIAIYGDVETAAAALRSSHGESFANLADRFNGTSRESIRRRTRQIAEMLERLE